MNFLEFRIEAVEKPRVARSRAKGKGKGESVGGQILIEMDM